MLDWLEDLLRDYLDVRPEPEHFQSQRTTRRGWLVLGAVAILIVTFIWWRNR
jgi:hypothetical protein